MISLEQAQESILGAIPSPDIEYISPTAARDRVLALDIRATLNLPAFDNSAMDGFAVRSQETLGATSESPITLRDLGISAAGDATAPDIQARTCVRIFTGAPIPRGADAVVMQEDTRQVGDQVHILDSVRAWENVRFKGEDIRSGNVVLTAGRHLNSAALGLIAALGINTLQVGRRPRLTILATGDELKDSSEPLAEGQIYESNRLMISAMLEAAGALCQYMAIVPDDPLATENALAQALDSSDAVVTTGGVSVGERDHIKAAFCRLGGQLHLWRVAIKPGKPFAFGQLGGKLLFALPGNPVSAFVTGLLLVRPAVLRFQGAHRVHLPRFNAVAGERFENRGDRRHFVRVLINNEHRVVSAGTQAAHFMGSLALAEGLVDLGPGTTIQPGETLDVLNF